MGRHSKQAGGMGSENLTHAERAALGFGTAVERLGKDSVKDFDACALCLQPVEDPVVTPSGVLYERQAILENLLQQKKEYAAKLALYEAKLADRKTAADASARDASAAAVEDFHRQNNGGGGTSLRAAAATAASQAEAPMKAFWLPSLAPKAGEALEKPSGETRCPATGGKLRLKDLVAVHFTPAPESEGDGRYMCPLCKETLTNVTRVVVLQPGGDCTCEACYTRFVAQDGAYDGRPVKGVIRLERGGTGFAATSTVEAKTYAPLGVGSGLADNRGQHAGGRSKFAGMRLR
jgi:nitric oxide synthase-interacting protein